MINLFDVKIASIYLSFQKFCSRSLPTAKRLRWTERETHHWTQRWGKFWFIKTIHPPQWYSGYRAHILIQFTKIRDTVQILNFCVFHFSMGYPCKNHRGPKQQWLQLTDGWNTQGLLVCKTPQLIFFSSELI